MSKVPQVQVAGRPGPRYEEVLTPDALAFVGRLDHEFAKRRVELLERRRKRRAEIDGGDDLDFLPQTEEIRADPSWRVAPAPPDLMDRRVEITGPTERKMTINALNSGARVWLADFEDATSPTWENVVLGQLNLVDALENRIDFVADGGKQYRLGGTLPTIMVRPRGWHLVEKHLRLDGRPMSAGIADFGLYFFHCAQRQLRRGSGPYFYLPKLENHLEARLWNDLFVRAQQLLGVDHGTIRATVLIETITAAFEMEEILFELREHSAGLNAGRWDYIFSVIKNFSQRGPRYVLPDRTAVTMTVPFMRAYTELLVRTCHTRGAHAIGGMAAFVPNRRDPAVTESALAKVRQDKEREVADGFDGSWVAHPDLVPICREVFDDALGARPNQVERLRLDVHVTADQLLAFEQTPGQVTEAGLRNNVAVSLRYLQAWLRGQGAVAVNSLMEDVATAEISRSQIWQWRKNSVRLADGPTVDRELVAKVISEEAEKLREEVGDAAYGHPAYLEARELLTELSLADDYVDFLTLPGYARLNRLESSIASGVTR